jgi:hypothetical protein
VLFGEETQKTPLPPVGESDVLITRAAPKILPFTHAARTLQPLEEGFESGFRPVEKPPVESANLSPSPSPVPPVIEEIPHGLQKPSKKNWLTFGEDEDF